MKFFRYFPTVPYEFVVDGQSFVLNITNPTVHFKVMERLKSHITVFHDYVVEDGERPDSVATRVYGSPDYTWVVLLVNNIMTLYDWPLSSREFDRFIVDKYGSVSAAQATPVYKTSDGYYLDATTYGLTDASLRAQSNAYDDELEKNEAKRRIKIIPTQFVEPLVVELRKTTGV